MPRQKRPHNLKDAIHFKSKLRYLVPSELETRLAGTNLFTKTHGGWSPSAKAKGIFFDLSRVEWVDLGALIQLKEMFRDSYPLPHGFFTFLRAARRH